MRKYLLVLVIFLNSWQLFAQKYTIYIDPTYSGVETGTIAQPYASLPSVKKNTRYLIKGGTILSPAKTIDYDMDSVTLGSYNGIATIKSSLEGRLINLQGNSVRIENLNVIVLNNSVIEGHGTNGLNMVTRGGRGYITNVSVNGGWRGIDAGGDDLNARVGAIYLTNVTINNTQHDGMYITHLDSLCYKNCKVRDVNLNWFNDYGGDGIQCGEINHVIAQDCYIDHTSTPGKYCFIVTNTLETKIDNCHFKDFNTEACLYPSSASESTYRPMLTITNSIFEGGWRGIQHRTDYTKIQNCLFVACSESEWAIDGNMNTELTNCTFVNYKDQLMGSFGADGVVVTTNTKNLYYNCVSMLANKPNVKGSYNDFYPWTSTMDEALVMDNPLYRDPKFKDNVYYEPTDTALVRLKIGWRYNQAGPTPPPVKLPGSDVITGTSKTLDVNDKIYVYPNPNNGQFKVALPGSIDEAVKIEIFDLLGQRIFEQLFIKSSGVVDVKSNLPAGQYLLKLSTRSKQLKTMKLLVN